MITSWVWALGGLLIGCSMTSPDSGADHDVQFIQIFYHSGLLDELDTFHGTYQKDLIPGTMTTTMWLTTREQEIILTKVERIRFWLLPDTVRRPPGVSIAPDMGPQGIRIKYKDQDKTIVWYDPMDSHSKAKEQIDELRHLLSDIIFSKPEYKALPPTKGGYM